MKVRVILSSLIGLSLMLGFQNCGAPVSSDLNSVSPNSSEKLNLVGRFEIDKFVSTSSCPDVDSGELACAARYEEVDAKLRQVVEFLSDGTLIIEGACNTYYSRYELESNGDIGRFYVNELAGTSSACGGEEAEEESLLVYRLSQSVRLVKEGPSNLVIFTDRSSALKLARNL